MNTLRSAFDASRREYNQAAPEAVVLALRREWGKKQQRKRRQRRGMSAVAAMAATLCLFVLPHPHRTAPKAAATVSRLTSVVAPSSVPVKATPSTQLSAEIPRHRRRPGIRSIGRNSKDVRETSEFVAIPYSAPLQATDQIDIYRVQMPRATLASYGMPLQPNSLNATVTADLLVGSDGIARAVRFVR